MIAVGNCLLSEDIIDKCFCCDLDKCRGCCCVEGDVGAPLTEEEISAIEDNYEVIKEYIPIRSREIIEKEGCFTHGFTHDEYNTPLVDGRDCVYLYHDDKIAKCGIQQAYIDGKIHFNKPVSCHLYPIRINKMADVYMLNYDRWDICCHAEVLGKEKNVRIYRYLAEPLVRMFGQAWYDELCSLAEKKLSVVSSQ